MPVTMRRHVGAATLPAAPLLAACMLLAGCHPGSGTSPTAARPVAAAPSESAPSFASPSTPAPSSTGPAYLVGLNGQPTGRGRPVLAVKIDNTRPAHPQIGLGSADVVYVESVEGQLTRLMAIFSSRIPKIIGPTRSARASDLELLAEYGRVDFAFSGANRGVLALVRQAPVHDVSFDTVTSAYYRDYRRPAPYNLLLRPTVALAATKSAVGKDIGLRFLAAVPAGGTASRGFAVRLGPYASLSVRYDRKRHDWPLSMDGRPSLLAGGGAVTPANVIVQYVKVRGSRFHDVNHNVSPYTSTVGTGRAVVYRDGRAYAGRWRRPSAAAGTRFTDAHGADLALRPGSTWIVLVPLSIAVKP